MKSMDALRTGILSGALAGLGGGLLFAITMSEIGRLSSFAELVRADSKPVGFVVIVLTAVVIGVGFGVLVCYQRPGAGETLFWGLVYGVVWWYLGPLTLLPLLQGDGLTWDVGLAREELPILLGLVIYGVSLGLVLVSLHWGRHVQPHSTQLDRGVLLRGALAGLVSAVFLGVMLNTQDQLLTLAAMMDSDSKLIAWFVALIIGLLSGLGFTLLYPNPTDGIGPGLIRGTVFGFALWVVAGLTIVPLLGVGHLTWSLEEVRDAFATMPGYLLFGAAIALIYQWLRGLMYVLVADFEGGDDQEGVGTQGLRIVGRSAVGGLVGGLIFSLVMLQNNFFPSVADLVGTTSETAGFFVHLAIAQVVGLTYGLLFRHQSYDLRSAVGWGVSYGFFWSILGPLTLMPTFLGGGPQWSVEAVAQAFPNLVGHLAYGAGLGLVFYLLEARYKPWWIARNEMQAAQVARRKEQVLTAAPAVWTLLVLVGLTLPVLLSS